MQSSELQYSILLTSTGISSKEMHSTFILTPSPTTLSCYIGNYTRHILFLPLDPSYHFTHPVYKTLCNSLGSKSHLNLASLTVEKKNTQAMYTWTEQCVLGSLDDTSPVLQFLNTGRTPRCLPYESWICPKFSQFLLMKGVKRSCFLFHVTYILQELSYICINLLILPLNSCWPSSSSYLLFSGDYPPSVQNLVRCSSTIYRNLILP